MTKIGVAPWGGAKAPQGFQKREKVKCGVFSCIKVINSLLTWAFLSSLMRKYMLWKGFYHYFSSQKRQLQRALPPDPHQGALPLDPRDCSTPANNLPWHCPWTKIDNVCGRNDLYAQKS